MICYMFNNKRYGIKTACNKYLHDESLRLQRIDNVLLQVIYAFKYLSPSQIYVKGSLCYSNVSRQLASYVVNFVKLNSRFREYVTVSWSLPSCCPPLLMRRIRISRFRELENISRKKYPMPFIGSKNISMPNFIMIMSVKRETVAKILALVFITLVS